VLAVCNPFAGDNELTVCNAFPNTISDADHYENGVSDADPNDLFDHHCDCCTVTECDSNWLPDSIADPELDAVTDAHSVSDSVNDCYCFVDAELISDTNILSIADRISVIFRHRLAYADAFAITNTHCKPIGLAVAVSNDVWIPGARRH
jgi:hypothetical protein